MTVFDPTRVGLVDAQQGNILIRGNYPLDANRNWAYGVLKTTLSEPLSQKGLNPDLDAYVLVDIAILSNSGCPLQQKTPSNLPAGWGEYDELQRELAAFGLDATQFPFNSSAYPPYGGQLWTPTTPYPSPLAKADTTPANPAVFHWWPLEAQDASIAAGATSWDQFIDPTDAQPASFQPGHYGFAAAVGYLHALMQQPATPPLAIYIHCTQGTDRTGALAAGYLLHQYHAPDAAIEAACASVRADFPRPNVNYCALVTAYALRMPPA